MSAEINVGRLHEARRFAYDIREGYTGRHGGVSIESIKLTGQALEDQVGRELAQDFSERVSRAAADEAITGSAHRRP